MELLQIQRTFAFDAMKKFTPKALFLFCNLAMCIASFFTLPRTVIPPPFHYLGIFLIVLGIAIAIKVRKQFVELNTEIHTFKTPRKMATEGLFKYSRNPIYLGFTIALIGTWLTLNYLLAGVFVLLFFLTANFWYIPYEENQMKKEFNEEYIRYKAKTRRWI